MPPLDLDPRLTFESFVVGQSNRLACAAARRVAESPGTTYNPLFIYSASGLGKTHLLMAIGNYARRIHSQLTVAYDTIEHLMDEVMAAIEVGERDAFRVRVLDVGLLLLDDVQFLAGKHRTQEELIRVWDALSARGGQVVLASDRPPPEIDGLDDRLLSRFSGGLIVDIGAPDFETRVAIVRRKAEEQGHQLGADVAEALAKVAFGNVRELQGALNRLIAVQELEGRTVTAEEVPFLLGLGAPPRKGEDEFSEFLAEITGAVVEVVSRAPVEQRLADAILRWEGEGYRTRRLEAALANPETIEDVESFIRGFEADVERLREIAGEISALDEGAPELKRVDILRDPDRISDAVALLGDVQERTRPFPPLPAGYTFETLRLPSELFALRAAMAVAEAPGERYNPLFVHGPPGSGKTALLAALGQRLAALHPERVVAFVEGPAFAAELIRAIERNRVEGWRARYRKVGALLLDNVDALAGTERAQEELFHLFEILRRAGVQLAFTAARPPRELFGIEERLRTRLESGLVAELPTAGGTGETQAPPGRLEVTNGRAGTALEAPAAVAARAADPAIRDPWFLDREKILWDWPYPEDLLVEEFG
jgi:chromosomal replication initiator protein